MECPIFLTDALRSGSQILLSEYLWVLLELRRIARRLPASLPPGCRQPFELTSVRTPNLPVTSGPDLVMRCACAASAGGTSAFWPGLLHAGYVGAGRPLAQRAAVFWRVPEDPSSSSSSAW